MDKYTNFSELENKEKLGLDFDIVIEDRAAQYAIIAIHGGRIEPYTTEIARSIAGKKFSFYSFMGIKNSNNSRLHITSDHFDEPRCMELVAKSWKVISVHGRKGKGKFVMVGGLDQDLVKKTSDILNSMGFSAIKAEKKVAGMSRKNICNRCVSGKGLQLEISRGLRSKLETIPGLLKRFVSALNSVEMVK